MMTMSMKDYYEDWYKNNNKEDFEKKFKIEYNNKYNNKDKDIFRKLTISITHFAFSGSIIYFEGSIKNKLLEECRWVSAVDSIENIKIIINDDNDYYNNYSSCSLDVDCVLILDSKVYIDQQICAIIEKEYQIYMKEYLKREKETKEREEYYRLKKKFERKI